MKQLSDSGGLAECFSLSACESCECFLVKRQQSLEPGVCSCQKRDLKLANWCLFDWLDMTWPTWSHTYLCFSVHTRLHTFTRSRSDWSTRSFGFEAPWSLWHCPRHCMTFQGISFLWPKDERSKGIEEGQACVGPRRHNMTKWYKWYKMRKQNKYSIQNKCDVHCEVPLQTTFGKIHRTVSLCTAFWSWLCSSKQQCVCHSRWTKRLWHIHYIYLVDLGCKRLSECCKTLQAAEYWGVDWGCGRVARMPPQTSPRWSWTVCRYLTLPDAFWIFSDFFGSFRIFFGSFRIFLDLFASNLFSLFRSLGRRWNWTTSMQPTSLPSNLDMCWAWNFLDETLGSSAQITLPHIHTDQA